MSSSSALNTLCLSDIKAEQISQAHVSLAGVLRPFLLILPFWKIHLKKPLSYLTPLLGQTHTGGVRPSGYSTRPRADLEREGWGGGGGVKGHSHRRCPAGPFSPAALRINLPRHPTWKRIQPLPAVTIHGQCELVPTTPLIIHSSISPSFL